jgi:hypothetical protein
VSRGRRLRGIAIALTGGLLGTLLVLEVVLRFLPVNRTAGFTTVSAEDPVLRLEANRCSSRSLGPRLALPTEVCVNNAGFRNDVDYELDASTPLLALVGDSYMIASTVAFEETMAGRLGAATEGRGRCYSFGVRGAAFPQYLVWAESARERYRPDGFVFLVIANDFRGSLRPAPGYHHFERREDGTAELVRVDSRHSRLQGLVRRSALASYLAINCDWRSLLRRSDPGVPPIRRFVGNIRADLPEDRLEEYRWVFTSFLDRLPEATGVGSDRIALVVDGMRPHMYDPADLAFAETSAWARLRAMVHELATSRGIEVIDLHPLFVGGFAADGVRFEHDVDNHWSGVGHGVAARATERSRVFHALFGV